MAVEVITHGRAHANQAYTATCQCGCVFKFLQSDAKLLVGAGQRDGDYLEIRCPECKTHVYKSPVGGYCGPG